MTVLGDDLGHGDLVVDATDKSGFAFLITLVHRLRAWECFQSLKRRFLFWSALEHCEMKHLGSNFFSRFEGR